MRPHAEVEPEAEGSITRRAALRTLGVMALGALAACSPLRLALRVDRLREDDPTEEVLRAFITTVAPSARPDEPDLTRAFYDTNYGFRRCTAFFVRDLNRRAEKRFGISRFDHLDAEPRARIVRSGLDAGGITARVYAGAVYLSQIAYYAGIYDADRGCPAIGFEGRNGGFSPEETTYPDAARFLGTSHSPDGNPA